MSVARAKLRAEFANAHLTALDGPPVSASADASFRSYWRVTRGESSWIIMDAPPDQEDVGPFVDIADRLTTANLSAPEVFAQDRLNGFLLLSDLGTRTYLAELNDTSVDALYADALNALLRMQERTDTRDLPIYDHMRLTAEMQLFSDWFLTRHLGVVADAQATALIDNCMLVLASSALEQPQAFVHRDYHSRNLMVLPQANPGVLDFQDAVLGPITYDLASLLKDCYIQWPANRVAVWAEAHRRRLHAVGLTQADASTWSRWFDWMGLQRHLKVLGIFARLYHRDGKRGYLNDLPLVLHYTLECCARYEDLREFGEWLQSVTRSIDITQPRCM